jgi:hypothetical protein
MTIPLLGVQKLPVRPEITALISLAALPARVVIHGVLGAPVPRSATRRKLRIFATALLPAVHSNIDIPAIDIDARQGPFFAPLCGPA